MTSSSLRHGTSTETFGRNPKSKPVRVFMSKGADHNAEAANAMWRIRKTKNTSASTPATSALARLAPRPATIIMATPATVSSTHGERGGLRVTSEPR